MFAWESAVGFVGVAGHTFVVDWAPEIEEGSETELAEVAGCLLEVAIEVAGYLFELGIAEVTECSFEIEEAWPVLG